MANSPSTSLVGKHVAIVGMNYWPEHTGNAPYTTGIAEYLAAQGTEVTVVTGMPHYPHWQVAAEYRNQKRIRETIRGVKVLRLSHHVPTQQTALRRALYEASFLFHALISGQINRPDVILGIVPSLSGGAVAAYMARRCHVPFGLLVQDLIGQAAGQSGMPGGNAVARIARYLEGTVARQADGVAIVTTGFRAYVAALGVAPDRIAHLPNWSHIPEPTLPRGQIRKDLGWSDDTQIVLHAGNMGLKQGLENVVAAARLAVNRQSTMRFVLMGDGNQRAQLETLADGLPNIAFLAPQSSERFPDVLAAADVLLVNQRQSVIDMSLPSKLTSYFVAGRPVVAAVALEGATAQELQASRAGVLVPAEDPLALVEALERLVDDPGYGEELAVAGKRYVDEYLRADKALARCEAFLVGLLEGAKSK